MAVSFYVTLFLTAWDVITDTIAIADFRDQLDRYESNLAFMRSGDPEASNFNETSAWYSQLHAEWESLSDHDKWATYCDVPALLSVDGESKYEELWVAGAVFLVISWLLTIGVLTNNCLVHCYDCCNDCFRECGCNEDPEDHKRAVVQCNFTIKFWLHLLEDLPQIIIQFLMLRRLVGVSGMDCLDQFVECGKEGVDCGLDAMRLAHPLDASFALLFTTHWKFTMSIVFGFGALMWTITDAFIGGLGGSSYSWCLWSCTLFHCILTPLFFLFYISGVVWLNREDTHGGKAVLAFVFIFSAGFLSVVLCWIREACGGFESCCAEIESDDHHV